MDLVMFDGSTVLVGSRTVFPPAGDSMRSRERIVAFIPTGLTGDLIEGVCANSGEPVVFTRGELLTGEFRPFRLEEALKHGRAAVEKRKAP